MSDLSDAGDVSGVTGSLAGGSGSDGGGAGSDRGGATSGPHAAGAANSLGGAGRAGEVDQVSHASEVSGMSGSWRLNVDKGLCIGSGICAATAPEHFELVDGVARPLAEVVDPAEPARDAADSCPMEAIAVRDAVTAELLAPRP